MRDLLAEYEKKYLLSKSRILSEIDEWLLYVFYLENDNLQLRTTYNSPIRDKSDYDDSPSFSIFERSRGNDICEFKWKDSAKNIHGNIFELLERMFNIDSQEVLQLINRDFCILDDSKEVKVNRIVSRPAKKSETRIRIKAKEFTKEAYEFWNQYYVTKELLEWKQVKLVEYIWYSDEQQAPYSIPKGELVFAYPEYNKKYKTWHYQIYSPLNKDKQYKFRNCLRHNMLYGNNHLEFKTDTLIITKSNKDILVLKLLGYEAVSPRSETTPIKQKYIDWYKERYSRLVLLYDNDLAGKQAAALYDLDSIFIPEESLCKDISDYIKKFGVENTKELMRNLLCGKI